MEKDLWINDFNPSLKKLLKDGYDFAKREVHLNVILSHYLILHFDKNPPKNQIQEKMFNKLNTNIKNGENVQLLKIDMSEFMEPHSISKLIGSPPGYIGYNESSLMSRYLARCSDRVILLDEIEKAHPQVLNLFLQVFDEGVLTDSHGIKINFSHSIFFLTSNLGHSLWEKEWKKQVGFGETRQNAS